jgi:hypothetical protein
MKRLMQDNKEAWHKNIIDALWEDKVTTKNSISTSPFNFVYGTDTIFSTSLGFPIKTFLQEK